MFEDQINKEGDVETLVVGGDDDTVFVVPLLLLLLFLHPSFPLSVQMETMDPTPTENEFRV